MTLVIMLIDIGHYVPYNYRLSLRLPLGLWMLFMGLVIVNAYTGTLTSHLTVVNLKPIAESLADVASGERYTFTAEENSAFTSMFLVSQLDDHSLRFISNVITTCFRVQNRGPIRHWAIPCATTHTFCSATSNNRWLKMCCNITQSTWRYFAVWGVNIKLYFWTMFFFAMTNREWWTYSVEFQKIRKRMAVLAVWPVPARSENRSSCTWESGNICVVTSRPYLTKSMTHNN